MGMKLIPAKERAADWKLGLDDDDVASAVEKVNAKNRARGYLA